jgi:hypothetical protein
VNPQRGQNRRVGNGLPIQEEGNRSPLETQCHVKTVARLWWTAIESLQCEAINQLFTSRIHQQPIVVQNIHSKDGELHSGQQKGPTEHLSIEGQLELLFPPAQYRLTSRTSQGWASRRAGQRMRVNREGSSHVHEETPVRKLVHNLDQPARRYGVD